MYILFSPIPPSTHAHTGSRSIAFNGQFVYVTSSSLKHLLKMGTGKRGTIRGYVYASREIAPGWVLLVGRQLLLFQLREEGGEEIITCTRLDTDTLEVMCAYMYYE